MTFSIRKVRGLTAAVLLIFFLSLSVRGAAQVFSLEVKDTPLGKALQLIQKRTGYSFLYFQDDVQPYRTSFAVKNASIDQVLSACLKDIPIAYSIDNRIVSLKKAEAAALAGPGERLLDVRGRVLNEKGEALQGASIAVHGKNKATTTDVNGEFHLEGISSNAILEVSYVGYTKEAVKLNGRSSIEIKMQQFVASLQDVSIAYQTGYEMVAAERATGSFSQPDKFLYDNRIAADVISKLDGITSGLVFNRDAGGNPSLQIRGLSTINANAAPLIVVDNFPYDGDINSINPNDIESVTLLKDAASASIWGASAGNGVIVITTKKAKFNQPIKVEFNANFTATSKVDLKYGRNFLDANDFINVEQNLFGQGFYSATLTNPTDQVVSPVVEILNDAQGGAITQQQATAQINALRSIDVRNALEKYFYRRTVNQQYALGLSGGTQNTAYLMSIGYDDDRSNQINNSSKRITANMLGDFRPLKNLEITGGVNYVQSQTYNNSILNQSPMSSLVPYAQFEDPSGNPLPVMTAYRIPFVQSATENGFLNWQYIPLMEKNRSDNSTTLNDIRLKADVKYTVFTGLSLEGIYQYETGISANRIFYSDSSYYARNLINSYASISPTGMVTGFNIPVGGILQLNNNNYVSSDGRVQLNFNRRFGDHNLAAIAGLEARELRGETNNNNTIYGYDPSTDAYSLVDYTTYFENYPSQTYGTIPNYFYLDHTLNRYRSYYANASYTYKELYTVSASGRIDQANILGVNANDRQVPLWSVGGKWHISKESMYHVKWLPKLDLRATYGFSGNLLNNGTAYTTARYASAFSSYYPPQYVIQSSGDPSLTWEKIGMTNVGLDFATAGDIFSGSLEYYFKKGVDMIGSNPVPSSTGFTSATINYGKMKGNGFDIVLNSENIRTRTFNWTTTLLVSHAIDKVVTYDGGSDQAYIIPGHPVNSVYAYKWAGLDPATGDPRGYDTAGKISENWDELVTIPYAQRRFVGHANPTYFGGLKNAFQFKGFTLAFNLSYKFGYYFLRNSINYYSLFYSWQGNVDFGQRWQKAGDEKRTNVPSMPTLPVDFQRDNFYNMSEAVVTKGDNIRLQDVILAYELGRTQLKSLSIRSLQLLVEASNLGILWRANKYGIDPDYQQANYVPPKALSIGVKVIF